MSTNKLAKNYYFSVWKHIKFFPISYDDWHGVQSYKQKRKSRSHNNWEKKEITESKWELNLLQWNIREHRCKSLEIRV